MYELLRAEVDEAEAETDKDKIARELADIYVFLATIANNHGIDLEAEVKEKMARNILKYPQANFQGQYEYKEAMGKSRSEWIEDKGEEWFYAQNLES